MDQRIRPRFIYGTAWKEERTQSLVISALEHGFRAIDTANQRKHYDEVAVGKGIAVILKRQKICRKDLFIQTKFTHLAGQDHRLPYMANANISTQVEQSFARSLDQLNTEYLDSYILHGPSSRVGLKPEDWEAWQTMESLYESGKTKAIGISNVNLDQLIELCNQAYILPAFVQNRCYAISGWDQDIRSFCRESGISYQGFSLLTANIKIFKNSELINIAQKYKRSISQIIFRFFLDIGAIPLTGTTSPQHMAEDLNIFGFQLNPNEIRSIKRIADQ